MFLKNKYFQSATFIIALFFVAACSDATDKPMISEAKIEKEPISLVVYKSPTCGCCEKWLEHAQQDGINAVGKNVSNLSEIKQDHGIAPQYQACHTAVSKDGYIFEGHVPVKLVRKFLIEKPDGAIGLSVIGMPAGSQGMEMGNKFTPYQLLLLNKDGSSSVYAVINNMSEQS